MDLAAEERDLDVHQRETQRTAAFPCSVSTSTTSARNGSVSVPSTRPTSTGLAGWAAGAGELPTARPLSRKRARGEKSDG